MLWKEKKSLYIYLSFITSVIFILYLCYVLWFIFASEA